MPALDPLHDFTPEKWDAAKQVLLGEDDKSCSVFAAAKAANVRVVDLNRWLKRSEEMRPEDGPLVAEIAEVFVAMRQAQAARLHDLAWNHAVEGVDEPVLYRGVATGESRKKFDHRLLIKLLSHRDETFDVKKIHKTSENLSPDQVYERILAGSRVAEARAGIEGVGQQDAAAIESPP